MAFQSFDFERTRWRLSQTRDVCTKLISSSLLKEWSIIHLYIKMNTVLNSTFEPRSLYTQNIKMVSALVSTHKSSLTSFTRTSFIEVPVPCQESEWMVLLKCQYHARKVSEWFYWSASTKPGKWVNGLVFVLVVSILPLFTIFLFDFGIV